MKSSSLIDSFRHAIDGVVHVFRTQRHMRFHFLMVVLVLTLAKVYQLNRTELLVLFFSVCFVLMTEMFNTAVEAVIDMVTQNYHPLAKHAKDVAAGAVLIASVNAVVVGFLLFLDSDRIRTVVARGYAAPMPAGRVAVIEIIVLLVILLALKAFGSDSDGQRTPISGYSAVGFSLATLAVWLVHQEVLAGILVLLLALVLAQACVARGLQSFRAVFNGALLGTCLPVILVHLLP
ncbi:MAG: diacylglycerol kinase [Armatimonadetes bacterium]|nr:diacylglycerol kinase [Armatimonadota bacterium]